MCEDKIQYKVEYRKRKTVGILINENGEVIVRAPIGVSIDNIDKIIDKKRRWIEEKVGMFKEREQLKENEIMYLGKVCKIKVLEQRFLKRDFVYFDGSTFVLNVSDSLKVENTLEKWLREECYKKVKEIEGRYVGHFPKAPLEIRIKEQKRKWGCCTYDNRMFFNWHLIMARESAIEYVVVHEMCHMIHKNHSKEFWSLVKSIFPNYKEEHLYLKEKGYLMKINV